MQHNESLKKMQTARPKPLIWPNHWEGNSILLIGVQRYVSLCPRSTVWIAKHVSAFILQIIPLQIGNLHSLLLNSDSKALLCSGHGRAGCGTVSLLLSRVRCRDVFLSISCEV